MPTLKYLGEAFDCATAIKGDDYIHLLDENGVMVAAFDAISDFSGFTLENGAYTDPTEDHDCYLAVVRDDGTIGKGNHTCADVGKALDSLGYSKTESLSNTTREKFGLEAESVPDDVFQKIANATFGWKLIKSYKTAGSYTFTVPDGVTEIGVYMIGAGGGGAGNTTTNSGSYYATGGAGGYGKNLMLEVTPGQTISVVVGKGGAGAKSNDTSGTNGSAGGTTSFNGETVSGGGGGYGKKSTVAYGATGGQGSDKGNASGTNRKLYGSTPSSGDTFESRVCTVQEPRESQNAFDPSMVSLCAGGAAYSSGNPSGTTTVQGISAMPDGTKGGDGIKTNGTTGNNDATGNGNGGGGLVSSDYCTAGSGSDGAVYIYARSVSV